MSKLPKLIKITSPELARRVQALAREDHDNIILPTHAVVKDGEIAGAWSMGAVPLAMCWHHTQRMTARDSLIIKHSADTLMHQATPSGYYFMACNSHSPFYPHMAKFGYKPVWPTNIFVSKQEEL